jgi:thioredoxin
MAGSESRLNRLGNDLILWRLIAPPNDKTVSGTMKPSFAIALFLTITVGLLGTSCGDDPGTLTPSVGQASSIASVESEDHWRQILAESDETLLVTEFYADWCNPCRQLAPIMDSFAERYKGRVLFYRIDVDVHRQLSRRYKVRGIPYTVLFFKGEIVDTLFGLQPAARYRESIEKQLRRIMDG